MRIISSISSASQRVVLQRCNKIPHKGSKIKLCTLEYAQKVEYIDETSFFAESSVSSLPLLFTAFLHVNDKDLLVWRTEGCQLLHIMCTEEIAVKLGFWK